MRHESLSFFVKLANLKKAVASSTEKDIHTHEMKMRQDEKILNEEKFELSTDGKNLENLQLKKKDTQKRKRNSKINTVLKGLLR